MASTVRRHAGPRRARATVQGSAVAQIAALSLQMLLGVLLPWAVVRYDLRKLNAEQLARAWMDATVLAAPLAFGPLCLVFHFVKTRRSVQGALLGFGACLGCYGVLLAISWLGPA